MSRIRVASCSASSSWRRRFRDSIAPQALLQHVGEASSSVECIDVCAEFMPDALFIDADISDLAETLMALRKDYPSVAVVTRQELLCPDEPMHLEIPNDEIEGVFSAILALTEGLQGVNSSS